MKALIWREYRLAKLQRGTVFTVWLVGTVFLLFLPLVCLIPMAFVTISLINDLYLYIAAFVALIIVGILLQVVALKKEERMLP